MHERGLTDVTSVPSRIRDVTPAAAVSVGTAPNHVRSRNDRHVRWEHGDVTVVTSDVDDLRRLCHPRIAVEPI